MGRNQGHNVYAAVCLFLFLALVLSGCGGGSAGGGSAKSSVQTTGSNTNQSAPSGATGGTSAAQGTSSTTSPIVNTTGSGSTTGATSGSTGGSSGASLMGPLTVCASNPRYFCDPQGNPVYLTGSHVWANLQDIGTPFDFNSYVNFLVSNNMNFVRLWGWEGQAGWKGTVSPFPFNRTSTCCAWDGGGKFDLTSFNQSYFDRLRSRVIALGQQHIYVDIMLFQGWDLGIWQNGTWSNDLYNAINNVNGWYSGDGPGSHDSLSNFQKAYIRKVIDSVNDLDNVLYEVSNEDDFSSANIQWQYAVINYIKQYEATKPKQHPVGMTSNGNGTSDPALLASAADWISPDSSCYATASCSPADGTKVLVPDTDHLGTNQDGSWVWKCFMSGYNPIFMDSGIATFPASTDSMSVSARLAMKGTGYYAKRIDLRSDVPRPDLSTTGYAMADPGKQYLIYQPGSGSSFYVTLAAGTYSFEWFNTSTDSIDRTGTVSSNGGSASFTPPSSADALLYLNSQ